MLIANNRFDIFKQYTGNTATAGHKNNYKEFEKIVVQVCLERAVSEEIAVVQLKTEHTTLTASKDIKNKFARYLLAGTG